LVTISYAQSIFMIPENKQTVVRKALQTAFGANEFEGIQQLTKGLSSALIFKIIVQGDPYLLRVITRTDAMGDPGYYFGCMKSGAEAELAPAIYYMNSEDRISITGFIREKPFSTSEAREKLPHLFQKLHSLPKFPFRINYFTAMEGFMKKFRKANIVPDNITKKLFEQYERIANVYPRYDQGNWVSCHNDSKPENILFDGKRPWLVDWEGAFLNDRYLDLAVVANFVVKNDKEEAEYLAKYFGEPADEYRHARFFIMSQMLHLYYFIFFLLTIFAGKMIDINNIDKPDFRIFHDRIWNGEINLADNDAKLGYAHVHLEEFTRKMQTRRLEDSLQIISGYSKSS